MKTTKKYAMYLVLIIGMLIIVTKACGQQRNALYFAFQPGDLGVGLRYDYKFGGGGLYVSLTRGSYKFSDGVFIKNHIKSAMGIIYYPPKKPGRLYQNYFIGGFSYHWYGARLENINPVAFYPLSFELGTGIYAGRFAIGIRYDIPKQEGDVDIGFNF